MDQAKYEKLKLIVLVSPNLYLKAYNYFKSKCLYFDNMMQFFEIFEGQEALTKRFVSGLPPEIA